MNRNILSWSNNISFHREYWWSKSFKIVWLKWKILDLYPLLEVIHSDHKSLCQKWKDSIHNMVLPFDTVKILTLVSWMVQRGLKSRSMFSLISLHIVLGYNEPVWGANGEIDPKGNNLDYPKLSSVVVLCFVCTNCKIRLNIFWNLK